MIYLEDFFDGCRTLLQFLNEGVYFIVTSLHMNQDCNHTTRVAPLVVYVPSYVTILFLAITNDPNFLYNITGELM